VVVRWIGLVLAGCGAPDPGTPPVDDDTVPVVDDTDTPAPPIETDLPADDSDPAGPDSDDGGDSDGGDTNPVDTDPVDTDPVDTEPEETGWVAGPAPSVAGAFVPVAGPAMVGDPVWVSPGDRALNQAPSLSVAWASDVNGDGALELIVSAHHGLSAPPGAVRARAYRLGPGLTPTVDAAASAALNAFNDGLRGLVDLDGDGQLDALLGRLDRGLAWGTGPGAYRAAVELLPQVERATFRASPGLALADVDRDGWLDLILAERSCTDARALLALRRTGPNRLEIDGDVFPAAEDALVWTVFPFAPTPATEMMVMPAGPCGPVDTHPGFYSRAEVAPGEPVYSTSDPLPADALFRFDPAVAGGPITRTEPMGGVSFDPDANGVADLALALDSRWMEVFAWDGAGFVDRRWTAAQPVIGVNGSPMFAWGVVAVDVDKDRLPDLVFATGDDVSTFQRDAIGPQHPFFWRSTGRFGFEDLTAGSGLEQWANWRSLTAADPDGDGDADLFLGGNGWLPELLRNDVGGGHGISLRLRGTTSNHYGVGARVRIVGEAGPRPVAVMGEIGTPELVAEPWLFLGTGELEQVALEIVWPSGLVQRTAPLQADRSWTISEPEQVVITPSTRRVPADGASVVEVRVTPRAADGAARPAAVSIELATGAPGEARISVEIDGVEVGVRPRIWFGG
jgi:hypothetical protein